MDTLLDRLETTDRALGVTPDSFRCAKYEACHASQSAVSMGGTLDREKTVKCSYVGERAAGDRCRRVYVGIDGGNGGGGPTSWSYPEARTGFLKHYRDDGSAFNHHYRWIAKVENRITGQNSDCWSKAACQKHSPCCLERFIQMNLVRCSHGTSMRSNTTLEMVSNCSHVLLADMREIAPSLVIFHGKKSAVLEVYSTQLSPWPSDTTGILFRFAGEGFDTPALVVNHPAWEVRSSRTFDLQWPKINEALSVLGL